MSVVFVLIALSLGVSIGYAVSPQKTSTFTQIQIVPTTITNVVMSTVIRNVTMVSSPNYPVLTVTVKDVLVVIYTPTCVTVSGQKSVIYYSGPGMQTTTVTYIYPNTFPSSSIVSVTTVFNNTNTGSDRTQSESISC